MQYAEKVALVPQHYAEDRKYKQIQKPGAAVAPGTLSVDIKRIFNERQAVCQRATSLRDHTRQAARRAGSRVESDH